MSKNKVFFIVFIVVILIAGCRGKTKEPPKVVDYRKGTEGLVLDIVSTPDRVYEGDTEVKMIIEIKNKGAFPQPEEIDPSEKANFDAYIWVGGYDDSIMRIEKVEIGDNLNKETLEGKSPVNPEGGFDSVIFDINVYELPSGTPSYKTPVIIDTTYKYKTIASTPICVDPNPAGGVIKDKVCDVYQYSSISLGSQGAPVAVTKVEEEATSNYLLFRIYVQNVGNGRVIPIKDDLGVHYDPNQGYDWTELNQVRIKEVMIGNQPLICNPDVGEYINVERGRGYILCKLPTTGSRVYKSPLNIELEYGYQTSIKKDIEVLQKII